MAFLFIIQTPVASIFFDGSKGKWNEITSGTSSIFPGCGNITDGAGNTYNTILIGTQCWIAKNLSTSKYNDGTPIPHVIIDTEWEALTGPGYCWYLNDSTTYGATYGAMYNWYTVNTGNLCPTGWHIPTDDEWKTMEMYIGMSQSQADNTGYRGTNEGTKLKSTHSWLEYGNGTDVVGFTALPGGYRLLTGFFNSLGYHGLWWTATEYSSTNAWGREIHYSNETIGRNNYFEKRLGISVRCIKD